MCASSPSPFPPTSTSQQVGYFSQMVRALQWCHSKGVVHRDVKPDNFLLAEAADDTTVKGADFGLSCRATGPEGVVHSPGCGTPHFVAPEMYTPPYTKAVDVWSLGVILVEAATGRHPLGSGPAEDFLVRLLTKRPELPRRGSSEAARKLDEVARRALRRKPAGPRDE